MRGGNSGARRRPTKTSERLLALLCPFTSSGPSGRFPCASFVRPRLQEGRPQGGDIFPGVRVWCPLASLATVCSCSDEPRSSRTSAAGIPSEHIEPRVFALGRLRDKVGRIRAKFGRRIPAKSGHDRANFDRNRPTAVESGPPSDNIARIRAKSRPHLADSGRARANLPEFGSSSAEVAQMWLNPGQHWRTFAFRKRVRRLQDWGRIGSDRPGSPTTASRRSLDGLSSSKSWRAT